MDQLAKNLTAAMDKKGVTVKWLAEHVGTSEKTITRLRTGVAKRPGLDLFLDISKALDVTLDSLVKDADVVIVTPELASLQIESDCLADKCDLLQDQNEQQNARVIELTDNVAELTRKLEELSSENLILREQAVFHASEIKRLEIENAYKDRLLEVHEHYMRKK